MSALTIEDVTISDDDGSLEFAVREMAKLIEGNAAPYARAYWTSPEACADYKARYEAALRVEALNAGIARWWGQ